MLTAGKHSVEFRFQRASELTETKAYDFALAYWHTIGFMTHDEIEQHFSAVCTALKPGASFLYVFQGPRLVPGNEGKPYRNWKEQNGRFILTEKSVQDGFRDENCIVIDTNTGEVVEYREHQRALAFEDVTEYLSSAGFSRVEAYKDFEKAPATPEEFSIFLCEKE